MQTQQYYGGSKINSSVVRTSFYDFGFQDPIARTFAIAPGDSLVTTCIYDTGSDTTVVMGPSSQNEMCIDFLLYYPVNAHLDANKGLCGAEGQCGGHVLTNITSITGEDLAAARDWPVTGSACDGSAEISDSSKGVTSLHRLKGKLGKRKIAKGAKGKAVVNPTSTAGR